MSDDRDPDLQALFAAAERELPGEKFTAHVMAGADGLRRRGVALRWAAVLALVLCAAVLSAPLQDAVSLLSLALTTPLFSLGDGLPAQVLLPFNTAAFPLALLLMALRRAHRRLFA